MNKEYNPDTLVTPGDILKEYVEDKAIELPGLLLKANINKKTIDNIIKNKQKITNKIAEKLEIVFSRPKHFWLALEKQYKKDVDRLGQIHQKIPKTIRVRIAVAIAPDGTWNSCGWKPFNNIQDEEQCLIFAEEPLENSYSGIGLYWIEADIPIPERPTIEGRTVPLIKDNNQ